MLLSRKWATGAGDGGDATATGTPPATDPNNELEQAKQELERLRLAVEQSKAEKGTLEQTKQALQAAEARLAELESNGAPPTPAAPANPAQRLLDEIAYYGQIVSQNPNDVAHARLLRQAQADYNAYQWQALRNREMPKLQAAPEKFRAEAVQLFDTGRYLTADDAIAAAKGIVLEREANQSEAERARRAAADAAAVARGEKRPDTGGGSGSEPRAVTEPQTMTGSEFKKRTAGMTRKDAEAEWKKLDSGQLQVDWTR